MSIDFKRISRTTVSALGATSLLAASLAVVSPNVAQAEDSAVPGTLAAANASIENNKISLSAQIASLDKQIAEVEAEITKLEEEARIAQEQAKELKKIFLQSIRDGRVTGTDEQGSLELIASSDSFSEFMGKQHYRDKMTEGTAKQFEAFQQKLEEVESKLTEAKEKRDGLVKLRSTLQEKQAAIEAQAAAQEALNQAAKNEEEYKQLVARQNAKQVASTVTNAPRFNGGGGGYNGPAGLFVAGGPGRAFSGSNCVAYAASRGKNQPGVGAAADMTPSSSRPSIGAAMIFERGEQGANGTYGHVGIVAGIYADGSVELDHANWGGGQTHFRSTGQFF